MLFPFKSSVSEQKKTFVIAKQGCCVPVLFETCRKTYKVWERVSVYSSVFIDKCHNNAPNKTQVSFCGTLFN